jgi:hypothetical protein
MPESVGGSMGIPSTGLLDGAEPTGVVVDPVGLSVAGIMVALVGLPATGEFVGAAVIGTLVGLLVDSTGDRVGATFAAGGPVAVIPPPSAGEAVGVCKILISVSDRRLTKPSKLSNGSELPTSLFGATVEEEILLEGTIKRLRKRFWPFFRRSAPAVEPRKGSTYRTEESFIFSV